MSSLQEQLPFCSNLLLLYPMSSVGAGSTELWIPTFALVRNILQDKLQGGDICTSPVACKATDFPLLNTLHLYI